LCNAAKTPSMHCMHCAWTAFFCSMYLMNLKYMKMWIYIHTYVSFFCISHINSIESLCASVAKQVSFQRLFESVK